MDKWWDYIFGGSLGSGMSAQVDKIPGAVQGGGDMLPQASGGLVDPKGDLARTLSPDMLKMFSGLLMADQKFPTAPGGGQAQRPAQMTFAPMGQQDARTRDPMHTPMGLGRY